jgi:hypothetical protein
MFALFHSVRPTYGLLRPLEWQSVLPALLIGGFTLVNLAYIAFACPYDLAPDEAHYWDWSRHLDYCYYSKGPMVAWLIRVSCELFGNTPFAVRFLAVLSGSALLMGMYQLSNRNPWVVAGAMCVPAFSAVSVLMTIDPPFLACWAWAAVLVKRAIRSNERWPWIASGVLVALGTLAKPTMLLFPVCVLLFSRDAQRSDPHDQTLRCASRQNMLLFFGIGLLGFLPIIVWNFTHDGVGLLHTWGHAGGQDPSPGLLGPLGFLGNQLGLLLGLGFYAFCRAGWSQRSDRRLDWWLSVPVVGFFLLFSVFAKGQANWAAAAYVTGFPMAVAWLQQNLNIRGMRTTILVVAGIGLLLNIGMRFPNLVRPLLAQIVPSPTDLKPTPIRQLDPTARLSGWKALAAEVDDVRRMVRKTTGREPLLAGMTWTIPGELGFYCEGRPGVYCFGSSLADRASQYDLWRPNPVFDAQAFHDETFVYVGAALPEGTFDRTELVKVGTYREAGVPLQTWEIRVCAGFRGFAERGGPKRY